ncbi:DUF4333 domain-containing protein [Nocardioides limicola]|uniref:DUF4333 domain-containing protein n=1 Tax=Nocardioides limicola TaxID=2803368 RepID=UPI00193B6D8C|nr:DUF4333 domain-containing protein [Nocardioides sp. DJM-14]
MPNRRERRREQSPTTRRVLAGVPLLGVGLLAVACQASAEAMTAEELEARLLADLADLSVVAVTCPEGLEPEVGESRDCVATTPGGEVGVSVVVTGVQGRTVTFTIEVDPQPS